MRAPGHWRRWSWLALVPLLGAAVVWIAGSEPALRFMAQQAAGLSGGKLAIQGVHGSLYGPLRIESLVLEGEEKRFELRGLLLDWSPRDLWHRHLRIGELDLSELKISEIKPSSEPLKLPQTLRLPFSLELPRARLRRLIIKTGTGEWTLSGIEFGLAKPDRTYQLDLRAFATPWGDGQARASLADTAPFGLTGQLRFRHGSGSLAGNLEANAAGQLARIGIKAAATLAGGQGTADILLTPFAHRLLEAASITARGIDPTAWDKALPRADLSLSAALRSLDKQSFAGTVLLRNDLPGTWDRGRLPLRELAARLDGTRTGMDLADLRLDLAKAGQFTGDGRVDAGGAVLDLHTKNFDPSGLHNKLRSLRLAGNLHVQADPGRQHLLADLAYQGYRLHLDGELRDRVLHLGEALLSSGGGSLGLYGTLGLDADHPFELAGALSGFDPAAFGAYPPARVNASFNAVGHLAPGVEASINFAVADSQFRHRPLSGQGNLRVAARRLWDSNAVLRLGADRLELKGAFGAPGDRLSLQIHADQLGVIHPALSGRVVADGEVSGSLAAPSGHLELRAEGLAWGKDYQLGSLHASARLDKGLDGELVLNGELSHLRTPQLRLDQASVLAQGRRGGHTLSLTARNPDLDLDLDLAGAWVEQDGRPGWSGKIRRLANQGRYPLALLSPAQLQFGADRLHLAAASFAALGARIKVVDAVYRPGVFSSRGDFTGLSVAALGNLAAWPKELGGDLVLGGDWDINAGDQVNGRITLARERGDLMLTAVSMPATALGMNQLTLAAEAKDDRLQVRLAANGAKLGRLRLNGESRLSRRGGVWGLASDAPIRADADLALQSLAWATPFIDKSGETLFDGSLAARLQAGGTLATPRLTGTVSGERFALALPDQGLNLKDGRFQAELRQESDQNILVLKNLSIRGGDGTLTGQGRLALRNDRQDLRLTLMADKLRVISRPDRLLILSGDGSVALDDRQLRLSAKLKADRGQIELTGEDAPTLSEDVVVLGRERNAPAKAMRYAVALDLDLNLGEHFLLKGRGIDAQMGGTVKLSGRQGAPLRANGSIRVAKGTYAAYGQNLEIERGILNFQGPVDNPGLNIVAWRKNQTVEAGVAITGTAQAPVVKLVSNPSVPDSEKLSWLVLGHGMNETGGQEFDALQVAAGALLGAGQSVTLQQRIAHAAGLQEVSLKGAGTLESAVLTLGKRLSSRAYLSYEQGLAGTESLVKINYTLTHRLSLRGQGGTTPAVDLFYTFSFD